MKFLISFFATLGATLIFTAIWFSTAPLDIKCVVTGVLCLCVAGLAVNLR